MKKFTSFSQYPSANGKYFYTKFFKLHHIDAEYVPLAATVNNIHARISQSVDSGIAGISISMPFKEQIVSSLDWADPAVIDYNSCNTIVVRDYQTFGYNTDIAGVIHVCKYLYPGPVSILGDGVMAKMFHKYLSSTNTTINMYSRKLKNWHDRHDDTSSVINCTGIGTIDSESPLDNVLHRKVVVDLAIKKKKLHQQCVNSNVMYISGIEFYKYQFLKQYSLYTDYEANELDFDKAECEKDGD